MRIRVKNQPKITIGRSPAVEIFAGAGAPGLVPDPVTESGRFLSDSGDWTIPTGLGDVLGPASSVNNRVAVFDGVTGKLIKDGGKTIAEIEAALAAPVDSVNGQTGVVVLDADDVGAYANTNPSNFIDAAGAPVQSVNAQTGTVVLDATDVGAYPDTNPLNFVDATGAAAAAPVQSVNGQAGAVSLSLFSGDYNDLTNKPTIPTLTSQLTNDSGFITSAGAPVQSVNSQTGTVVLTASDVGAYPDTNPSNYITSSGAPVQSVAGKTGTVTLVKGDVGLGNIDNTSDLNKPISTATQTALNGKVDETVATTGTSIDFTAPKVFGSSGTPETGNITEDLTGAVLGTVQKIYHNHSVAPTVPAGWVLLGSGTYTISVLNIIYAEFCGSGRVEYWIIQEA